MTVKFWLTKVVYKLSADTRCPRFWIQSIGNLLPQRSGRSRVVRTHRYFWSDWLPFKVLVSLRCCVRQVWSSFKQAADCAFRLRFLWTDMGANRHRGMQALGRCWLLGMVTSWVVHSEGEMFSFIQTLQTTKANSVMLQRSFTIGAVCLGKCCSSLGRAFGAFTCALLRLSIATGGAACRRTTALKTFYLT